MMNAQPRLSALERRQTNLETRVEEIAQDLEAKHKHLYNDMSASFNQITEYFIQIESRLDTIEPAIVTIESRLDTIESTMATKDDLKGMATKEDITAIESTMATKDDLKGMATKEELSNMETRILNAFNQLVNTIRPQNSSSQ